MCNFWSSIIDRNGKIYHLGEIVSHEEIIEQFKLKDTDSNHICRIEIPILKNWELLPESDWKVVIDEKEKPNWFQPEFELTAKKELNAFLENTFNKKWLRFKKLNKANEELAKKSGEQIIYREKLEPAHEKLIVKYYLLGEKKSWVSVWDSVWVSVWDSVWVSVWDSVWASVRDSVRGSVWASVRVSVRASVRDSVWASQFPNKKYPLALPKKIFDLGYLHCLITDANGKRIIMVYGKKGKLLKKIDFKGVENE